MDKFAVFTGLIGGLGMFLYGMKIMGDGLENVAGERLKSILEKLTSNRYIGVLVGALVTAVIQSSSATTVMVVSFVNAGLLNLVQAVGVIMGANIGTTITAQMVSLDIDAIAPLFIGAGAFHVSKPSDLIPELQGRFPIRVELESLTKESIVKIFNPEELVINWITYLILVIAIVGKVIQMLVY